MSVRALDDLARHLQVRRQILGHQRHQAARIVEVDSKTWSSWETGVREPFVHQYPAILRYLEYEPWPPPTCLAEALLAEAKAARAFLAQLFGQPIEKRFPEATRGRAARVT